MSDDNCFLSEGEKAACKVAGSFVGTMVPYAVVSGLSVVNPLVGIAVVAGAVAWVIDGVRKTNAEEGKK